MNSVRDSRALHGQIVVAIGGSAGIGLETARQARSAGADVIVTARDAQRLDRVANEPKTLSAIPFDATDFNRLKAFFDDLPSPVVR